MARRIVALGGLVLVLGGAGFAVREHEATLAAGTVLYLELAPVDPRSLMQGDYMALRFKVGDLPTTAPDQGRMVVRVDERRIATFTRLDTGEALAPGEALLEYRRRKGRVRIVTDAFFFEEGRGGDFSVARYGELRVRPDGVGLLVALRDAKLAPIVAKPRPKPAG